jgi:16S rRNA (adenine1518-N6/adenine1519-N6)-dimethyltransferase
MRSNKNHPFRKKWGQNFLRDDNIINKIITCLQVENSDTVLEIGPGEGALTYPLSKEVKEVHAVEIDPLLVEELLRKKPQNMAVHQADFLDWDLSHLPSGYKVIGNLPYYISSPILFKLLEDFKWSRMVLMFQKEVAQRIISSHGNKSYGRLSVMCQAFCKVNLEFTVSKHVFIPKPEINSAVVSFSPLKEFPIDISRFSEFIKLSFSQRRKLLKNNLAPLQAEDKLEKFAQLRPEEIRPEEFIELYSRIYIG